MKTFEQYLQERHADDYNGTDDNMPDAFDAWLGNLDGQEYIDFADAYGKELIYHCRERIVPKDRSLELKAEDIEAAFKAFTA